MDYAILTGAVLDGPASVRLTTRFLISAYYPLGSDSGSMKRRMVYGGNATSSGERRKSWLRKSRAVWPRCQQVRQTDINTA